MIGLGKTGIGNFISLRPGWLIQNRNSSNIEAGRGVAIREFQLTRVHGFAETTFSTSTDTQRE